MNANVASLFVTTHVVSVALACRPIQCVALATRAVIFGAAVCSEARAFAADAATYMLIGFR